MRDYELMWILGGEASEEDREASVASVSKAIEDNEGSVSNTESWGHRTLAYPIEKNTEGIYYVARFSMEATRVETLEQSMRADQSVIRHLLTRLDDLNGAKVTPQEMDAAPPERGRRPGPGRGGPGRPGGGRPGGGRPGGGRRP